MSQTSQSLNFFQQSTFWLSVAKTEQLPAHAGSEIVIAGRSNAGKSSLINALCRQKGLARTSNTPGRTQLLNFFRWSENGCLVDLPGYGHAEVPWAIRQKWEAVLAAYLTQRTNIAGLLIVMDARHPLQPADWQMLAWSQRLTCPILIALNKADKLGRGAQNQQRLWTERELKQTYPNRPFQVQLTSAETGLGLLEVQAVLAGWHADFMQTYPDIIPQNTAQMPA